MPKTAVLIIGKGAAILVTIAAGFLTLILAMRLHMGAAIFVAIFLPFILIFLPLILSGERWRAAQDRAGARRMAEHRMNARLLRLNI